MKRIAISLIISIFLVFVSSCKKEDRSLMCLALQTECYIQTQENIEKERIDIALISNCLNVLKEGNCDIEEYKTVFGIKRMR